MRQSQAAERSIYPDKCPFCYVELTDGKCSKCSGEFKKKTIKKKKNKKDDIWGIYSIKNKGKIGGEKGRNDIGMYFHRRKKK